VLERSGRAESFTVPHPAHVQQPLIQAIVDELHGRGASPSTGISGARTTRVMEALLRSYYEGGAAELV
jgi:1,5-anhydro-D-fructose reductase (1,5-anhydro-D-mannitol-forming)